MERKFMKSEWRKKYLMLDMTVGTFANWLKETDVVLLPIGSCEQHGPHMPLGTDVYGALLAACQAAELAQVPVAPCITFGWTPYHMGKPGAITLRDQTLFNLLYDVCRSLIHHGFNKIVTCIGHRGSIPALKNVARKIRYETGALIVTGYDVDLVRGVGFSVFELQKGEGDLRAARHGGEVETANVLAWNPDLVDMEKAAVGAITNPSWLPPHMRARHFHDVAYEGYNIGIPFDHYEFCEKGFVGDATKATKEKGEQVNQKLAEFVAKVVSEMKSLRVEVQNRDFVDRV